MSCLAPRSKVQPGSPPSPLLRFFLVSSPGPPRDDGFRASVQSISISSLYTRFRLRLQRIRVPANRPCPDVRTIELHILVRICLSIGRNDVVSRLSELTIIARRNLVERVANRYRESSRVRRLRVYDSKIRI